MANFTRVNGRLVKVNEDIESRARKYADRLGDSFSDIKYKDAISGLADEMDGGSISEREAKAKQMLDKLLHLNASPDNWWTPERVGSFWDEELDIATDVRHRIIGSDKYDKTEWKDLPSDIKNKVVHYMKTEY